MYSSTLRSLLSPPDQWSTCVSESCRQVKLFIYIRAGSKQLWWYEKILNVTFDLWYSDTFNPYLQESTLLLVLPATLATTKRILSLWTFLLLRGDFSGPVSTAPTKMLRPDGQECRKRFAYFDVSSICIFSYVFLSVFCFFEAGYLFTVFLGQSLIFVMYI